MKLRLATENDKGPFLAGLIECDQCYGVLSGGSLGACKCNGTGWISVPVVLTEFKMSTLALPIAALHLSIRSRNSVLKAGCKTLGDLTNTTPTQLMAQRNFGVSSLAEVEAALDRYGFKLLRYTSGRSAPKNKKGKKPAHTYVDLRTRTAQQAGKD